VKSAVNFLVAEIYKLIYRGGFLCGFAYVNIGHLKVEVFTYW
jgi:hypothetical protein